MSDVLPGPKSFPMFQDLVLLHKDRLEARSQRLPYKRRKGCGVARRVLTKAAGTCAFSPV